MSKENNGGPVFPTTFENFKLTQSGTGISMRDYFAAHAPITLEDAKKALVAIGEIDALGSEQLKLLADMRFSYADTMLKARQ